MLMDVLVVVFLVLAALVVIKVGRSLIEDRNKQRRKKKDGRFEA